MQEGKADPELLLGRGNLRKDLGSLGEWSLSNHMLKHADFLTTRLEIPIGITASGTEACVRL